MIVLALGMSSPFSMIVVQTSTLISPEAKSSITCSSWSSAIWPWPTANFASGTSCRSRSRQRLDALDAVVDEEDLPAAIDLAQDRLADQIVVELADVGADRQALLRRRLDHAHVAHVGQRHVQRARDRRRASASARPPRCAAA